MNTAAQAEVADLDRRRIEGFRDGGRQGKVESTTANDVDTLNDIVQRQPEDVQALVYLYQDVWREFAKGERCGVCGRTPAQSAAINYDCIREC